MHSSGRKPIAKANINKKYLAQYAEPEVFALLPELVLFKRQPYQYSLVIPAYEEDIAFIDRFIKSPLSSENVLLILVINEPEEQTTGSLAQGSKQQLLYQQVLLLGQVKTLNQTCSLVTLTGKQENINSDILVVNRFTVPIANKQGVGLARKIGCDLALAFIEQGLVISAFIASTDADAILPDNYFAMQASLTAQSSAAYYDFYHHSDHHNIHQGTALYESALRYYVAGLQYAGSPYAFFTIGSILLLNATSYAQARGFPKRSAGEDFYLLNKLAKLGQITFLSNSKIKLQARLSQRVPFGTGPAVSKILQLQENHQAYCYYHEQVFTELKLVLSNACLLHGYVAENKISLWLALLPEISQKALIDIAFLEFIHKQQGSNKLQFDKQFIVWFDAFKTLKFIHALRHYGLADVPLAATLKRVNFKL